jgi:TPR repeat protein
MHDLEKLARRAEDVSRWRDAEHLWRSAGRKGDADACKMIANAIAKGDEYRARVDAEAGPQPDPGENPFAFTRWYEKMNKIYNQMFR